MPNKGTKGTTSTTRKQRGRTNIGNPGSEIPSPTRRSSQNELRTQASRPQGTGVVKRGDRRDMHKTYTGNDRHAARGNTPRANVATRKD